MIYPKLGFSIQLRTDTASIAKWLIANAHTLLLVDSLEPNNNEQFFFLKPGEILPRGIYSLYPCFVMLGEYRTYSKPILQVPVIEDELVQVFDGDNSFPRRWIVVRIEIGETAPSATSLICTYEEKTPTLQEFVKHLEIKLRQDFILLSEPAGSGLALLAKDISPKTGEGKRKRGPNTDTPQKLNRLVEKKRKSIRNRIVTVSFSKACDLADVSPETVKTNAPEIQKRWSDPDHLPEFP